MQTEMDNPQNSMEEEDAMNADAELARDIARLYSWANVEDAAYHSFTRRRKPHSNRSGPSVEEHASEKMEPKVRMDSHHLGEETVGTQTAEKAVLTSAAPVVEPVPTPAVPPPAFTHLPSHEQASVPVTMPWQETASTPVSVAVYSLAGGVGKTTLCANLGRILCSLGEQVLLVDASGCGLLPFYFGASDLRPGLRTFKDPQQRYAPVRVLGAEQITPEWFESQVKPAMQNTQRVIFDLGPASVEVLPQVLEMSSVVLIPVLSDLNSILTISRIEAGLKKMRAASHTIPAPYYVFNEFDEQNPIDQKARALVKRQVGERLLPWSIRYSAVVANAIADRMTVADHAPDSAVTHDFMEVASWLRVTAPVAELSAAAHRRWSEQ
jgi:cellulose biosynthesis protein BcsQ